MKRLKTFGEFSSTSNTLSEAAASEAQLISSARELVKNSTPDTAEADLAAMQQMAKQLQHAEKNEAWLKVVEEFMEKHGEILNKK
jgi:hypothetical protein